MSGLVGLHEIRTGVRSPDENLQKPPELLIQRRFLQIRRLIVAADVRFRSGDRSIAARRAIRVFLEIAATIAHD